MRDSITWFYTKVKEWETWKIYFNLVLFLLSIVLIVGGLLWFVLEQSPESALAIIGGVMTLFSLLKGEGNKKEQVEHDQHQANEQKRQLQKRLIRDAGSKVRDVAVNAIEELRHFDLLKGENGVLKNLLLNYTDLSEANLGGANLERTHFMHAKLQRTNFSFSKMASSALDSANLQGAYMRKVDLTLASLRYANLKGVDFEDATLVLTQFTGSDFTGAILLGANLYQNTWQKRDWDEIILANTILPDGTQWTRDTDLSQFTDFEHPDFPEAIEKINGYRKEMGLVLIEDVEVHRRGRRMMNSKGLTKQEIDALKEKLPDVFKTIREAQGLDPIE